MTTVIKKIFLFILFSVNTQFVFASNHIVFLGDSLTEGYGIAKEDAYPSIIEKKMSHLRKDKIKYTNAGISGSTTASGLSRLKWLLKSKPTILVLALGANDGLRGIKPEETKKNLLDIIKLAKENQIMVLLAGMKVPPNYGPEYEKKFRTVFSDIANETKVELVPFLLEGVAGEPQYNIADGIHPNPKGHEIIADLLLPVIGKMLNDQ